MTSFQKIHQKAESDLISVLQEVENSKVFFEMGFTSLFQYVSKGQRISSAPSRAEQTHSKI